MKYDLNKALDVDKFKRYSSQLVSSGAFVELRKINQRSGQQNRYLHLILSWFASNFGYTLEYQTHSLQLSGKWELVEFST